MTGAEERRDAEARKYSDSVTDEKMPAIVTFHWSDIFIAHKKGQRIGEANAEAKIAELERELREARAAIRCAPIETDGSGCYKGVANEWFALRAVQAALKEKL